MQNGAAKQHPNYTLSVLPGTDIGVFHWVGPITLEDRVKNLDRMVSFCNERRLKKIIIDGRDQISQTDTIDAYTFGKQVPKALRGLRVAVVHRPDDDTLEFIETVAFNRGAGTRAFHDFGQAQVWLEAI